MAILGFACTSKDGPFEELVAAYGSPSAGYIIKGTITSAADNSVIKDIRVVVKGSKDTIKSDQSGVYSFKTSSHLVSEIPLVVVDTDGIANGSFEPKDTLVTFINPKFSEGKGWYLGETENVVNIKLKPKG